MKKKLLILFSILLIVCIILGITFFFIYSKASASEKNDNVTSNNTIDTTNNNNSKSEVTVKNNQARLNDLPDTKFLAGKVGSNALIIKLDEKIQKGNTFDTTSFYVNQGGQLDTQITTKGSNYIITELYANSPIGVYTLKKENNKLIGSFDNLNDSSRSCSNVEFEFTNSYDNYLPQNDTMGFAKEVFQKEVIDANSPSLADFTTEKSSAKPQIWDITEEKFNKLRAEKYSNLSSEGSTGVYSQIPMDDIVLVSDNSNSFRYNNNIKLGRPDFILNGIKIWRILVWPAYSYFDGARSHGNILLGSNGFIYNNEDIFEAAENGILLGFNQNQLYEKSNSNQYIKLTPNNLLSQSQTAKLVVRDNGSCFGLIYSASNPDTEAWMNKFYKMSTDYWQNRNNEDL